ncbi:MAG: hypothetical protein R3282_02985, partial [Rhodothermales bacterium]|nr:hypothetical protein [Rhodothermales bacterium]
LWNLRGQFPGTIGAEIASAESVLMLEGIDDSLAIARAGNLDANASGFDEVARAVRRAESRLRGLDAAIDTLRSYERSANASDRKAAITSEIVLALVDSGRVDEALQEARRLASTYEGTEWASWAEQATYELQSLMPGMEAPPITARTWSGATFALETDGTGTVVLEFFRPGESAFLREVAVRDSLVRAMVGRGIKYVSISVEPDSVINEAFFESRGGPDVRIALSGGLEDSVAQAYNVRVVPRRFLLNNGTIVGKYSGTGSLQALGQDVFDLAARPPS